MHEAYLTTWLSVDERLSLTIEVNDGSHEPSAQFPYLVSVFEGFCGPAIIEGCPAEWIPLRADTESDKGWEHRLDRLIVELEVPGIGPTYTLYFATVIRDDESPEESRLGPVPKEMCLLDIRGLPEFGSSYLAALVGPYDDTAGAELIAYGWTEPYSSFRILELIP